MTSPRSRPIGLVAVAQRAAVTAVIDRRACRSWSWSCGAPFFVIAERVADPGERVGWGQGAVVGEPADRADQGE